MDEVESLFLGNEVRKGMARVQVGFQNLRQEATNEDWSRFTGTDYFEHSLVRIMHEDPFTYHSFTKPRNYAGDAKLIDYMYGLQHPDPNVTDLGSQIFNYSTNTPAPQSVRARKEIIASMVDELAEDIKNPRILSIACGHLREATASQAVLNKNIGEYFALDQDPLSLEVVKKELTQYNIKPINSSVKSLLTNGHEFQNLDFVYAAGLFDYLPQAVAVKLTARMFGMLNPGGKLLVANFAESLMDIGYMETFMQWKLIYRNETEVADFARRIAPQEIDRQRLFWDEPHNVIYLEVVKK